MQSHGYLPRLAPSARLASPPSTGCLCSARAAGLLQKKKNSIGLICAVNAAPILHADPAAESMLQPALRECVARAVRRYLTDLHAQMPHDLYELVLHEVETPLLREVLHWCGGNQSKAACALGINRATLRKKLALRRLG
jgi:Fis family transcriptional regulator, factor for inversion stimulation protein